MSNLNTKEQRASYIAQAQQLLSKPDFSKEDRSRFDALMALADSCSPEADNYRIHRLNAVLAEEGVTRHLDNAPRSEVSREIRSVLKGEVRTAMSVGTNNAGGYFVPAQFERELVLMQKASGPLFADSPLLTNIPTADGGPRTMPASDDLANEGYVQNENSAATEADPTLSQVSMHATTFSSGSVLVSNELVEDAWESIELVLQRSLSARLSRAQNKQFLSSLLTTLAANSSAAVAAGGAAIAADDIHNLIYSVNAQYRASAKCAFLLNSSTAKSIAALKDSGGRYVYKFQRDDAGNVSLEGFPVYFSDYCDNVASTKNPILFGDFSYIMLRHIPGITLQVLSQRYADQGSTAVIARKRADMQYSVPSTSDSAIKMLHFA